MDYDHDDADYNAPRTRFPVKTLANEPVRDKFLKRAMAGDGSFAIAFALLEVARWTAPDTDDLCSAISDVGEAIRNHAEATQNIAAMLDVHECGKSAKS